MKCSIAAIALAALTTCCRAQDAAAERPRIDAMIARIAALDGVPAALVQRVVRRESGFNPRAHGRSFWGLMQIRWDTARALGYRGRPEGLLDPQTNLTFGVLYLANAWRIAGGQEAKAMRLYSGGYYYEAKRRGRLSEIRTIAGSPSFAATSSGR